MASQKVTVVGMSGHLFDWEVPCENTFGVLDILREVKREVKQKVKRKVKLEVTRKVKQEVKRKVERKFVKNESESLQKLQLEVAERAEGGARELEC